MPMQLFPKLTKLHETIRGRLDCSCMLVVQCACYLQPTLLFDRMCCMKEYRPAWFWYSLQIWETLITDYTWLHWLLNIFVSYTLQESPTYCSTLNPKSTKICYHETWNFSYSIPYNVHKMPTNSIPFFTNSNATFAAVSLFTSATVRRWQRSAVQRIAINIKSLRGKASAVMLLMWCGNHILRLHSLKFLRKNTCPPEATTVGESFFKKIDYLLSGLTSVQFMFSYEVYFRPSWLQF